MINAFRHGAVTRRGRILLGFAAAGALGLLPVRAADELSPQQMDEARAAAQHWLGEIDADKLEQSYLDGCTAFHNKVSKQQWITVLTALRPDIGKRVTRKEIKATYKPDGFEGLDGEILLLTYDTIFSKLGETTEIVELKREDGAWRGAGYNAQPNAPPPEDMPPPTVQPVQ